MKCSNWPFALVSLLFAVLLSLSIGNELLASATARYGAVAVAVVVKASDTFGVHRDCVCIVIDRGEIEVRRMCEHRSKPKRRARSGVEAEFSDEYALLGELYNFARVIGVQVYGVTIAGNQVSIGREHQSKRIAQVPRVVK